MKKLVVLLVVFWMLHRTPKVERLYSKLTSNVQDAGLFDNELYYFTGSFFAKYLPSFLDLILVEADTWQHPTLPSSAHYQFGVKYSMQ